MLLCYQLMLLERSFVISHNLYIVEWVYIVLKRYTHKYRLLIWNLSIEKHYQSWLYLWNCCNKSDVALFSVSTQSIKYKVKSLYRYMLKSVFFQVPGGKACNEFLFLNLVSVYFKLIKEWEKTRGAGHFWRFKFWSTLFCKVKRKKLLFSWSHWLQYWWLKCRSSRRFWRLLCSGAY